MSDLLSFASKYTNLNRKGDSAEYAGPCPKCGGVDRFTVHTGRGRWYCRVGRSGKAGLAPTHPGLWSGDLRDLRRLVGDMAPRPNAELPPPVPPKPGTFNAAQWSRNLAYCGQKLTPGSEQGRYLASRAIAPATWRKFHIGAGYTVLNKQRYDTVIIPWHDQAGALCAISHRLLAPPSDKNRYQVYGDKSHLFGWCSHSGRHVTLIIVEGELNAMSLHQAVGVDVLSVGSQNAARFSPDQVTTISQWQRVLLWADIPTVAERWQQQLGRGEIVRAEHDANWLLVNAPAALDGFR